MQQMQVATIQEGQQCSSRCRSFTHTKAELHVELAVCTFTATMTRRRKCSSAAVMIQNICFSNWNMGSKGTSSDLAGSFMFPW